MTLQQWACKKRNNEKNGQDKRKKSEEKVETLKIRRVARQAGVASLKTPIYVRLQPTNTSQNFSNIQFPSQRRICFPRASRDPRGGPSWLRYGEAAVLRPFTFFFFLFSDWISFAKEANAETTKKSFSSQRFSIDIQAPIKKMCSGARILIYSRTIHLERVEEVYT